MKITEQMGHITKVYILQSLKTTDKLKSGNELHKNISKTISTDFVNLETDKELSSQLDLIKLELKSNPGQYVLHFDCHGNKDGIGIYDKVDNLYFIHWNDLRRNLREIYLASNQKAIISFSSCEGFNVAKLIAHFEPCPFYLITGSFKKIGFQDSIDGYSKFYKNLDIGKDYMENIKEIRDNFPSLDFASFTAEQLVHIGWKGYKQLELTPERIKERKEKIKAEIVAIDGAITKEQEEKLSKQFTKEASIKQFKNYRKIFFS